jgi:CO/xanthine dehydrogenase Mo-binding subunit
VETDLTLTVDGTPVELRSTGERLFLEVPTLQTALRLARDGEGLRDRVSQVLTITDLTVEVRVRGATVAVAGHEATPGALSRELGVDPVEIRVGGGVAAVGRELLAGGRWAARLLE